MINIQYIDRKYIYRNKHILANIFLAFFVYFEIYLKIYLEKLS